MSAEQSETPQPRGPELARAAIEAAKAARVTRTGRRRAHRSEQSDDDPAHARRGGYTRAGPDPRDPQLFGSLLTGMVAERGWRAPAAEGTVFGAWDRIAGPDIASHCRPVSLRDGELTLQAESTAWATQLRMFTKMLLAKIAETVGDNVVKRIRLQGPTAPSWRKGRLVVKGQGPRDTYG